MAIVPLAWLSTPVAPATVGDPLATDADLQARHPRLGSTLWENVTSFSTIFTQAYQDVLRDLQAREFVLAQIPNSDTNRAWAKEAVIRKALYLIFLDFLEQSGDRWDILRKEYKDSYASWMAAIKVEYDLGNDGEIGEDDEEVEAPLQLLR